jgi:hypothetical protein
MRRIDRGVIHHGGTLSAWRVGISVEHGESNAVSFELGLEGLDPRRAAQPEPLALKGLEGSVKSRY